MSGFCVIYLVSDGLGLFLQHAVIDINAYKYVVLVGHRQNCTCTRRAAIAAGIVGSNDQHRHMR